MNVEDLVQAALKARVNALAHYSGFKVGAALETADGKIYTGCNVENATYGLTVCAERVALWKAISEGERKFQRMVVATDTERPGAPCGAPGFFLRFTVTPIKPRMINRRRALAGM